MKLLSTLSSIGLPVHASVQVVFTALILGGLIGLELAGRSAQSDAQDSIYGLVLIGLVGLVAVWHRRRPLAWVDWLGTQGARLLRWLKTWRYSYGVDFRGTPPLPRRVPRAIWGVMVGLIVWAIFGVVIWYVVPGGWRTIGVKSSYVLYLIMMVIVWAVHIAGVIAGLFLPPVTLDRRLVDAVSDSDRRLVVVFAGLSYLLAVGAAAALIPVAAPLVLCAVGATVAVVWASRRNQSGVAILWQAARGGAVYSIPIHRVMAGALAVLLLILIALVTNGRSGRLLTPIEPTDAMPFTASLAALVAWTAPGLLLLILVRVREKRRIDPANRTPPTLHVTNKLSDAAGEHVKQVIAEWGWKSRITPEKHASGDIRIELVHPEMSEATEFNPVWPLKMCPADLANPLVKERLARRDEIHLRRRVIHGLNRLIKRAIATRGEKKGGGFWIAPHWWFIDGVWREDGGKPQRTEDGESELFRWIGASFTDLFGIRPRQHLHKMLQAVQIDVIYIEDGVPLKTLAKVMRMVFEVYDIHGGKKLVDDHCFRGIPKVRVIVHEHSPLKPSTAVSTYRQLKFDDLSRVRVLHIFRDKGDHEEVSDMPRDFDYVPSPVLMG
jgi:hypothetical protein